MTSFIPSSSSPHQNNCYQLPDSDFTLWEDTIPPLNRRTAYYLDDYTCVLDSLEDEQDKMLRQNQFANKQGHIFLLEKSEQDQRLTEKGTLCTHKQVDPSQRLPQSTMPRFNKIEIQEYMSLFSKRLQEVPEILSLMGMQFDRLNQNITYILCHNFTMFYWVEHEKVLANFTNDLDQWALNFCQTIESICKSHTENKLGINEDRLRFFQIHAFRLFDLSFVIHEFKKRLNLEFKQKGALAQTDTVKKELRNHIENIQQDTAKYFNSKIYLILNSFNRTIDEIFPTIKICIEENNKLSTTLNIFLKTLKDAPDDLNLLSKISAHSEKINKSFETLAHEIRDIYDFYLTNERYLIAFAIFLNTPYTLGPIWKASIANISLVKSLGQNFQKAIYVTGRLRTSFQYNSKHNFWDKYKRKIQKDEQKFRIEAKKYLPKINILYNRQDRVDVLHDQLSSGVSKPSVKASLKEQILNFLVEHERTRKQIEDRFFINAIDLKSELIQSLENTTIRKL